MADATLIDRLRAGGIVRPKTTIAEAQRAGLELKYACALLEKESAGGHNVFGHDPTIFVGAGEVTKEKYAAYKRQRGTTHMQGVGPCQLTWWEFQDQADREGGCWRPEINMRVGFRHLAELMKKMGPALGAQRYNGTGPAAEAYSRDLLAKAARWESRLAGAKLPAVPVVLKRGHEGKQVERLTKRLSYVRPRGERKAYLDGGRSRLDAEAEMAVKAFQRDHGLVADGIAGPRTIHKLNRAVKLEKVRREKERERGPVTPVVKKPRETTKKAPVRLPALVEQVRRLDAETDRAWTALVAYGRKRERLLARARTQPAAQANELGELTAVLLRIESKLGTLVDVEQRELALETAQEAAQAVATAREGAVPAASGAAAEATAPATVVQVSDSAAPPAEGSVPLGNGQSPPAPPPKAPPRSLREYSDDELIDRIARLDHAMSTARGVLIRRFAGVESELVKLGVAEPVPKDDKGAKGKDKDKDKDTKGKGGGGAKTVTGGGKTHEKTSPDAKGREHSTIVAGNHSLRVRQSKIALARYLKHRRRGTTKALRRKLQVEVRTPKTARTATPAWEKAVREAQQIAGLPVTGDLDDALQKRLAKSWPSEAAVRRMVRATPAWRLLPGQLSRNFKLSEFACHDGTPYIEGLMREKGLSKKQAKDRAKQMADRLERLREKGGNRPLRLNSVFRTNAYNASIGGVPGSAHTHGYAADSSPPAGVPLTVHRAHVRAIFSGGCGYYPTKNFIHGDFMPSEANNNWTG